MREFKHGAPKNLTTALNTTENFHLWANGSTGNDANPGTEALPKKTIAALFDATPVLNKGAVCWHLRGTFTVQDPVPGLSGTDRKVKNVFMDKLILDGGDEVVQLAGPFTSDSSAWGSITTTGAGWTADEWEGKWVRILSGPAAGDLRTISYNTTDTLKIMGAERAGFSVIPGICQYDIVRPATTLQARPSEWTYWTIDFSQNASVFLQRLYITANDPSRTWTEQLDFYFRNASYNLSACVFFGAVSINVYSDLGVRAWTYWDGYFPDIDNDLAWDNNYRPCSICAEGTSWIALSVQRSIIGSSGLLFSPGDPTDQVTVEDAEIVNFGGWVFKGHLTTNRCKCVAEWGFASYLDYSYLDGAPGVGWTISDCEFMAVWDLYWWSYPLEVKNCGSHGIELINSTLKNYGAITGSGNTGAGVYAHSGSKLITDDGVPSTLTGTVGDLAVSDPTKEEITWADLDAAKFLSVESEEFYARTDVAGVVQPIPRKPVHETTGALHVYVDGDSGNDANGGTSWADAVQSIPALNLPYVINHNLVIHCRGALNGNWSLTLAIGEAWQPTIILDGGADQTEVVADDTGSPWTADIATTLTIGKTGAGWTTDQFMGLWVEILSGPYAGYTRQIQGNTADTLTVTLKWAGAPSGAQFRIIQPSTVINGSTNIDVTGVGSFLIQNLRWAPNEGPYLSGTVNYQISKTIFDAAWGVYPNTLCQISTVTYSTDADTFAFLYGLSFPNMGLTILGDLNAPQCRINAYSMIVSGFYFVQRPIVCAVNGGSRIGNMFVDGAVGQDAYVGSASNYSTTRLGGNSSYDYGLFLSAQTFFYLNVCDISGCSGPALELNQGARVRMGSVSGSGNGKACYPHDIASITLYAQPTLSGTVDGVTLDGSTTAATWASIWAGTPLVDANRGVLVRKEQEF